jgi:hypothetical protein
MKNYLLVRERSLLDFQSLLSRLSELTSPLRGSAKALEL